MAYFICALGGRARTGYEKGGKKRHIIQEDTFNDGNFSKALCGAEPGRRSYGWQLVSWMDKPESNCEKCLKKQERNLQKARQWTSFSPGKGE